jgi:hypothetical protein
MAKKNATTKRACNYCTRPVKTITIVANDKLYCGKLCAALGPIAEVHKKDTIVGDLVHLWATDTIEGICYEGPKRDVPGGIDVPVKVRWSQAADVEELHASAPKGINYFAVSIDDEGTPDWEPAEPGPFELALKQCNEPSWPQHESKWIMGRPLT